MFLRRIRCEWRLLSAVNGESEPVVNHECGWRAWPEELAVNGERAAPVVNGLQRFVTQRRFVNERVLRANGGRVVRVNPWFNPFLTGITLNPGWCQARARARAKPKEGGGRVREGWWD